VVAIGAGGSSAAEEFEDADDRAGSVLRCEH